MPSSNDMAPHSIDLRNMDLRRPKHAEIPAAVAELPPPPRRISVAEITAAIEKALASIDLPVTVRVRRILVDPEYSIEDDELLTAGVAVKLGLIAREEP